MMTQTFMWLALKYTMLTWEIWKGELGKDHDGVCYARRFQNLYMKFLYIVNTQYLYGLN